MTSYYREMWAPMAKSTHHKLAVKIATKNITQGRLSQRYTTTLTQQKLHKLATDLGYVICIKQDIKNIVTYTVERKIFTN